VHRFHFSGALPADREMVERLGTGVAEMHLNLILFLPWYLVFSCAFEGHIGSGGTAIRVQV
jgi:hypothetical protein